MDSAASAPGFVVKLGGSVDQAGKAAGWLRVLWTNRQRQIALVPGGGAFADDVRRRQAVEGFDDSVAHRQALRAMELSAARFTSLGEGMGMTLTRAEDAADFARAFARGQLPAWYPVRWADGALDLERSWQVTSDTLALWLADRLRCGKVVLIKSVAPQPGVRTCAQAADAGWIDAGFERWRARTHCKVWLFGAGQEGALAAMLAGDPAEGALVT
ncbi:MAG: uridylate kinase [Betaproteobacteria bacterium]|nr:uridylate kinase [Betaproteobacteria bacterium]